jgi:hypothetical protein
MLEAKKAAQLETSWPVPRFPDGILEIRIFLKSSLILSVISVCINPGDRQFILITFLEYYIARLLEKPIIPALDAA